MNSENQQQPEASPLGSVDPQTNYRKLGQPRDTVSGTTQELFEVRGPGGGSGSSETSSLVFKIIAVVAIIAVVLAMVAVQIGLI